MAAMLVVVVMMVRAPLLKTTFELFLAKSSTYIIHAKINGDGYSRSYLKNFIIEWPLFTFYDSLHVSWNNNHNNH
jgi:hypothetical protein